MTVQNGMDKGGGGIGTGECIFWKPWMLGLNVESNFLECHFCCVRDVWTILVYAV